VIEDEEEKLRETVIEFNRNPSLILVGYMVYIEGIEVLMLRFERDGESMWMCLLQLSRMFQFFQVCENEPKKVKFRYVVKLNDAKAYLVKKTSLSRKLHKDGVFRKGETCYVRYSEGWKAFWECENERSG